MEANEQNQAPEVPAEIPAFEQNLLDTQVEQASDNGEWEKSMGLPRRSGEAPQ